MVGLPPDDVPEATFASDPEDALPRAPPVDSGVALVSFLLTLFLKTSQTFAMNSTALVDDIVWTTIALVLCQALHVLLVSYLRIPDA